jgi:hypothetical protein
MQSLSRILKSVNVRIGFPCLLINRGHRSLNASVIDAQRQVAMILFVADYKFSSIVVIYCAILDPNIERM